MEFQASVPLWDLSTSYGPSVSDDDFLALLQKDFSAGGPHTLPPPPPMSVSASNSIGGVSPQQLAGHCTPPLTDDSSPSPPASALDPPLPLSGRASRRVSFIAPGEGSIDATLKRKASGADLEGGARKAANTDKPGTLAKGATKKSPQKDEGRLMRRKEQNRAAQRAFRERKEKHVQDLEGRVAELEAAQRAKDTENDNLRDLLTRLQEENRVLKESAFSFSMPPPTTARTQSQQQQQQQQPPPPPPLIHHSSSSSSSASQFSMPEPSVTPQLAPNSPLAGDIDWASLTTFDPAALNMLDADINMMDFSADGSFPDLGGAPYRTLASNPMFMSFAEPFSAPPSRQGSGGWDPLSFASFGSWAGAPVQSPPQQQQQQHVGWPPSRQSSHSQSEFDALLGLAGPGPMMDIATPNSISPILHASGQPGPRPAQRTSSGSSTLPDLSGVTHPFQYAPGALGGASPGSASSLFSPEPAPSAEEHNPARCPRTKADFAARIANGLKSPFAPAGTPGSVSASPSLGLAPGGAGVSCEGSAFPKTERSEHNIEVLQAWRQITSDPAFKNIDINELCAEFTNKAKCDGTRVVLDPAGVSQIISKFSAAAQAQTQAQAGRA